MLHPIKSLFFLVIVLPIVTFSIGAISRLLIRTSRLPVCPNCLRREVRRDPRHGVVEETIAALRLFPFRCNACLKRFYAFDLSRRNIRHEHLKRRRAIRA